MLGAVLAAFRSARGVRAVALAAAAAAWLMPASAAAQAPAPASAQLSILQINDVYETGEVDGRGGLARVAALDRRIAAAGGTPLLVLAGDFLGSSVASTIFKGAQMVAAFNAMGLDFATLGNHEFDFGKDVLLQRMAESTFVYLVANVLDESTGRPVGGALAHTIRTFNGLRVGFFGVCLTTEEISAENRRGLRFLDPLDAAGDAVAALTRDGVDVIVGITHLSFADDRRLARRFPEVAVIAGGHEHVPITAAVDRTLIVKAGANAAHVARIDLRLERGGLTRQLEMVPIDAALPDDPATAAVVREYDARLGTELDVVVATSRVPLDAGARTVRSGETNLGNLVADAIRAEAGADVAIVNAGSIRGDRVYPAGPLSRRTLLAMQPFGNAVAVVRVPGRTILRALNAGASQWPEAAGRFPQVSGLIFTLDARRAADDRVTDVRVGGAPLALDRLYTLALPDYLLAGGDGYDMFGDAEIVRSPESGALIVTALEHYVAARKEIEMGIEGRIRVQK
jgi:5'-nucleotidase